MANATSSVKKGATLNYDHGEMSSKTLASATTYYSGAMVGINTDGYVAKFDDTASMLFLGIVRSDTGNVDLPAGTQGDGTIQVPFDRPDQFKLAISGVAVTDIGKIVYASDDQTGVLSSASLTYANVVGSVVGVASSGIAWVKPNYDGVAGHKALGAHRRMAASGAQTVTMFDVGKTIACANTTTLALTLPAVASIGFGAELVFIKDHASDTNAITLTCAGSDSIDGSATLASLDAAYDAVTLVATNTNRYVAVSRDIA